ncbi:MAG: hypothetical protein BAJALOKI3v1_50087 [Promethearchaeota archaeon]|nr:MAG: hypothetical protein BAJALOKI3v1_50087 [Candidatus Lokiarchaeota archaeon]
MNIDSETNLALEHEIRCSNCNKPLVNVGVYSNKGEIVTRYRVIRCAYCGGKSFLTPEFRGKTIFGSVKENIDVMVDNIETKDDTNSVVYLVTKIKE